MWRSKAVDCYWWTEIPNFGDRLAPLLLEKFSGIQPKWNTISRSRVATVGSILEHIPPLWDGHILGAGKLFENSRLHLYLKTAKIWALRGPLSARDVPWCRYALGDPGLLADELVGLQEKRYDLGIVPHWQDTTLAKDPRFQKLPAGSSVIIIDPTGDPLSVVRQIGQCRKIVTSSLHGMIVADTFSIPRRVEMCPGVLLDGGDFKFRDYSASIGLPFEVGKLQQAWRSRVEDRKHELYDAYRELGKALL